MGEAARLGLRLCRSKVRGNQETALPIHRSPFAFFFFFQIPLPFVDSYLFSFSISLSNIVQGGVRMETNVRRERKGVSCKSEKKGKEVFLDLVLL